MLLLERFELLLFLLLLLFLWLLVRFELLTPVDLGSRSCCW